MKIHENIEFFKKTIQYAALKTGIRTDILEKDYYVTLILSELAEMQEKNSLRAYFKGGTALYKTLNSFNRFSEDIDLTVDLTGCNGSQAKKKLRMSAKEYTSIPRTGNKENEIDCKNSITAIYDYTPVFNKGDSESDRLHRFGHVKVEATSFTLSEPYEEYIISSPIYDVFEEQQKNIIGKNFTFSPFKLKCITLERIFTDKFFAAQFYYQKGEYIETSKHLYDIFILLSDERIKSLMLNIEYHKHLINLKRKEEKVRIGSDLAYKDISEFNVYKEALDNAELRDNFYDMQNIYIFDDKYKTEFKTVIDNIYYKLYTPVLNYHYAINIVNNDETPENLL